MKPKLDTMAGVERWYRARTRQTAEEFNETAAYLARAVRAYELIQAEAKREAVGRWHHPQIMQAILAEAAEGESK